MIISGRVLSALFILISCVYIEVQCANATDKTSLNAALLTGYNPSVHPGSDYTTQLLNINVSFVLVSIKSFEEQTGELSIMGYFNIYWTDERLAWDPSSYSNINGTNTKQKEIWTPPFILADSSEDVSIIGDEDMPLSIYYTGVVLWSPPGTISSTCNADVTYYPFDLQTCLLRFMPWGYTTAEIQINAISSTLSLSIFSQNPTWELTSTKLETSQSPMLNFQMTISFKRRDTFFIVNLILPVVFMCFINMFAFQIPLETGDRLGFATTLLLTIAVFLSVVTDALPQSSTPSIPLLCYLLIIHILLSMMIVFCTIFGLRLYVRPSDEPVPKWVIKLTKFVHVITCNRKKISDKSDSKVSAVTNRDDGGKCDDQSIDTEDTGMTWMTVSNAFDKFFMLFFMMVAMICNLSFIFLLSSS
ncbi:acetylcholine receptor subunit beta-type lev-1-like [Mizuhopecten yessoensis]|uniref:Acetylcholine receptor subunit beta-type lev-1 n=1 Tax=Mizuhopecten yessoensis TaxID=6573 RepID=A0A210QNB9_MIZYE|nr:acetylcholine receptor subunit beta-type lev-1-like [Mizuhopecten yessoensis]OWF50205.1 Acetylcholine receptor subunit beta-type lev-1 [Mizuhopecten yessoensis]